MTHYDAVVIGAGCGGLSGVDTEDNPGQIRKMFQKMGVMERASASG